MVFSAREQGKGHFSSLAAVLIVTAILLWPAYVNGEPFYMPDTSSYLRGADAAIHRLTGESSVWTQEYLRRYPSGPGKSEVAASAAPVVLAGRSIYYGSALYAAQWFGNFWAVAVLQALLVAVAITLSITALRSTPGGSEVSPMSLAISGLLLAVCTPVAYFASFLLPDVFGALGLLAFLHLVFFWDQYGRHVRLFWFALVAAATLFHFANFAVVIFLALAAGVGRLLKLPASRAGLFAVAGALVVSVIGQSLFSWGVKYATGTAPVRPPFVAARIIADGPGYEYLREHCPNAKFIFCRVTGFENRISDALLWSIDSGEGIFQSLTPTEQRLAATQENQFVLAVLQDRPLDLLASSIGAFFRQLTTFNLESFNYTSANEAYFNRKLPSPFIERARQSRAFKGEMPVTFVEWATVAALLVSLVVVCWRIHELLKHAKRLVPASSFLLFLIVGVLINAAICGALSTPKARYQMRLIWVLPLAAISLRNSKWEPLEVAGGEDWQIA